MGLAKFSDLNIFQFNDRVRGVSALQIVFGMSRYETRLLLDE
jgi:hypothetical protein